VQHSKCFFNCFEFVKVDTKCFFKKGLCIINAVGDGYLVSPVVFIVKHVLILFDLLLNLSIFCCDLHLIKSYFFIIFIEKTGNVAYLVFHFVYLQVCS